MTAPGTPVPAEKSPCLDSKATASSVVKHSSLQALSPAQSSLGGELNNRGGSLPTTPAKLIDVDPAIVLSVKSRNRPEESSGDKHDELYREIPVTTVTTPQKNDQTDLAMSDANRTKSSIFHRNWRTQTDPFFARPAANSAQVTAASVPEKKSGTEDEVINKNGNVTNENVKIEDVKNNNVKSPAPKLREDRDHAQISAENAQGFYNAEYCVFVANLTVGCPDQDLEAECKSVFSRFGRVYTKIRRDRNGMPYAFCQYETEADAKRAIDDGHGLIICGRPCRVERARANREKANAPASGLLTRHTGSVYLSRTAGGSISEDQARAILKDAGAIEKLWYATDTDKEVYRLPDGIWATFAYFQDARDAQNDSKEYRLEVPYSPEDHERARTGLRKYSPLQATPLRGLRPAFRWPTGPTRFAGTTSVFIGNLPLSASLESIRETFEVCGSVRTVEIIGKANGNMPGLNAFAFVEFGSEMGVKNALNREFNFNGRRLRIELRESQDQFSKIGPLVAGSPRNRVSLTPRTPHNNAIDPSVKPVITTTTTPARMVSIYENSQQTASHPQTPAQQVYHPGYYYGSPYGSYGSYGSYYPGPPSSAGQTTAVPTYAAPQTGDQAAMGHYAYSGYYPGYNVPYLYASPPAGENVQGNGQMDPSIGGPTIQGVHPQDGSSI